MKKLLYIITVISLFSCSQTEYSLTNKYIARTISVKDSVLQTTTFTNKLTNKIYNISGKEFEFKIDGITNLLTSRDFRVERVNKSNNNNNISEISIFLKCESPVKCRIKVIYTLAENSFYGNKKIEILSVSSKDLPAEVAKIESLEFTDNIVCTSQGFGQPIYLNDMFFGLEWPVAQNTFKDGRLTCSHKPGFNMKKGSLSQQSVWGATPKGRVKDWFINKYVDEIRKTPVKPSVLYNSWYDVRDLNKDVLPLYLNSIKVFKKELEKKQGIDIDYFVPDDAWQNRKSIYGSIDSVSHMKLRDAVEKNLNKSNLGLWMPIHACRAIDMNWARENGYEIANPKLWGSSTLCLSHHKYRNRLEQRLKDIILNQRITYFKHDNNNMWCPSKNHGHRPNSDSQVEEMFEIMDYMKKLNPEVYLNYTTGMNMSPWWLKGCDCIWIGGGDVGNSGQGNKREQAISYRDKRMKENQNNQFPMNSLMTHGIIKGRYMFGFRDENIKNWEHYVWMFVSRGVSMFELYLSPEYLSQQEWDFLGSTLRWTNDNMDILTNNTSFILGDVRKNEPYGYAHTKGDEAILFLRNPSNNLLFNEKSRLYLEDWRVNYSQKPLGVDVLHENFNDNSWTKKRIRNTDVSLTKSKNITHRCKFDISESFKGKKIRLHFDGADDDSEIYLNGKILGKHKGTIGVRNTDGSEMKGNWHYNYKSYYKYNASGFHFDIDSEKFNFNKKNIIVVKQNNTGEVGGVYGNVTLTPILGESKPEVSYKFNPQKIFADKKYTMADTEVIYPKELNIPRTIKKSEPWKFTMNPFDVYVIKLKMR